MKLDRTVTLKSFKFISLLCSIFLLIVLIKIIFNDNYNYNMELSLNNLEKEKENKLNFCENKHKSFNKILLEIIPDNNKCIKLPWNLEYLLAITENKYVYYSFALVLGGVINMRKIMKIGIY